MLFGAESSMLPVISSFVFFDLETTGLPWQERNQTKIIELSMVSTLRSDILTTSFGEMPAVKKLTFVLNPDRQIHPEVTKLTGLSNDLLKHAPSFREKINMVTTFLESLPQPVCLVAHNGNIFDFKILLAECKDAFASLPDHLLCVDSLVGFRKLLKGTDINHTSLSAPLCTSSGDYLLTNDEDWPDLNISTEEWNEIDEISLSLSDISCEDFEEAAQREKNDVKATPQELEKKTQINKEAEKKIKEARSKAIKKVFENGTKKDKECFTMSALYKRLLNKEEINAHRAEADCLMLLQCVVALKNDFLPWADGACKLLTDIQPLVRIMF